ncbi:MAG: serine/threonine transporter SstT [Treponema sp.]|nr:serine/threonine transporter SstT [Treponema sp.]
MLKKWNDLSLIFRIACGLVLGVILGLIFPNASAIGILGDIFVGALKSIAPILVFFLVISAVANASNTVSKRFRTVVLLYILSTLLASILAVIASKIFPISLRLVAAVSNEAPEGIAQVFKNLLNNIVQNPIASIANANYIGILAWAIVLGLALKKINHQPTNEILVSISDAVSATVRWIINLAPLGILGLVFVAISTNGLSVFVDYGKLLLVLVGCMLFLALVINPFITFIMLRKNPYPLVWRCLKESGITAFFTRSSAANIPVNMELCRKLGLDKDIYSISIPLGATINMDGAAITIAIMTLAAANTMGISVDIPSALILCVMATLGACGASGVAGGSLLLIPMACSLFGIGNDVAMQVVGVGFIIGVIQDSLETALNSSGDVLFTATAEFYEWRKQGKEIKF